MNSPDWVSSTIKSISEIGDCNISFGEQIKKQDNKSANLPEIKKLEKFKDFLSIRAKADSEALRLKYSNIDIFNSHKPKGDNAVKLYEIAEKIRYEKIGCDQFCGIKKNLFEDNNQKKYKAKLAGYACIIDRSNGKSKIDEKIVSQIEIEIPTYKKENLPKHLQNIKPIKPGSRSL